MTLLSRAAVVIGWIDASNISRDTGGVSPDVASLYVFYRRRSFLHPMVALANWWHLGVLRHGRMRRPAVDQPLTARDCDYILRWLFWQGANPPPPAKFTDDADLKDFLARPRGYKLANHLAVKFDANGAPTQVDHRSSLIGSTTDPFLPIAWPGQHGKYNGVPKTLTPTNWQVNDGTPDHEAISIINNLAVHALSRPDRLWNNIGSRLELDPQSPVPRIKSQVYPTYYVYPRRTDGSYELDLTLSMKQMGSPLDNFHANGYHWPEPMLGGIPPFAQGVES